MVRTSKEDALLLDKRMGILRGFVAAYIIQSKQIRLNVRRQIPLDPSLLPAQQVRHRAESASPSRCGWRYLDARTLGVTCLWSYRT